MNKSMLNKLAIVSALCLPVAVLAQTDYSTKNLEMECAKTEIVIDWLSNEHNEVPFVMAGHNELTVTIWKSLDNKTGTIVISDPKNKISCVVLGLEHVLVGKESNRRNSVR